MLTPNEFRQVLFGADNVTLDQYYQIMQEEYFSRRGRNTASVDMGNGHKLVAEATYSDFPEVNITLDGDENQTIIVTQFQDHDEVEPDRIKTYLCNPSFEESVASYVYKIFPRK